MTTLAWPPAPIPTTRIMSNELADEHERFRVFHPDSGAAQTRECADGGRAPRERIRVCLALVQRHDRELVLEHGGDVAEVGGDEVLVSVGWRRFRRRQYH